MGHSINRFKEGRLDADDGVIVVWIRLVLQLIDSLPARPSCLSGLYEEWLEQAELDLSGNINLDLEELLTDAERIETVRNLSLKAIDELKASGDFLSKDYLNQLTAATSQSHFTRDVETAIFIRFGEAFIDLLDGKIRGYSAHS
jgi:hypothetical protein